MNKECDYLILMCLWEHCGNIVDFLLKNRLIFADSAV